MFGGQSGGDNLETNKDADVYDPVTDSVKKVAVNAALSEPTVSNFYATMFVLPQGKLAVFNHNHAQVWCYFCLFDVCCVLCDAVRRRHVVAQTPNTRTRNTNTTHPQVVDPATGAALAASPPAPNGLVFEYMYQGAVAQLRPAAPLQPGQPTRFEFVVFGGGYPDDNPTPTTPCADIAV